ncbi:Hsp20/alpha crystallin family protein [Desertibaculum subflavum]|uniref:Hsp20/alpha crystallin family protein n=1 Tax=Desertibaculum subflavum TaxID=2268458 RepID=UPI000E662181
MSLKSILPSFARPTELERGGNPFFSLQSEINRMFDDAFRGFPSGASISGLDKVLSPAIDVKETEQGLEVSAELPGIEEKDLDVSIVEDLLTIKAEKKQEQKKEEKGYYMMERSYGTVSRSIRLPFAADPSKVSATFDKGVLKIAVPRPAEEQAKVRKIQVKPAA